MTLDFTGRTVLVTGGTRGIGRAIAQAFMDAGATVFVCGRRPPEEPVGSFVAADVRSLDDVQATVDAAVEATGAVDGPGPT